MRLDAFCLVRGGGRSGEAIACHNVSSRVSNYILLYMGELTETGDRATNDELWEAVRRRLHNLANHPEGKAEDECAPTPKQVTDEDCRDS
jgi:hypothetical protein